MSIRGTQVAVTATGIALVAAAALITTALTSPARHAAAAGGGPGRRTVQPAQRARTHLSTPQSARALQPVHAVLPATPASYLGVYESGVPQSYQPVQTYAQTVGRPPGIVMYFTDWGGKFQTSFAKTARSQGATVLVDLDPTSVSLASIADGLSDRYLQSYADEVRSFGHPVIISFGHEMNGNWYPWGWTNMSPGVFVAAWRHVVTVFRDAGADNVTWLWTVNDIAAGEPPVQDWWPGASYVTWIGIDGYFFQPSDTFTSVFGLTITAIREFTDKPILISETAVGQVAGQAADIPVLFAGVSADHLLGLVWFDVPQNYGLYHQDWRLEGNPAAVAAFRSAAQQYIT